MRDRGTSWRASSLRSSLASLVVLAGLAALSACSSSSAADTPAGSGGAAGSSSAPGSGGVAAVTCSAPPCCPTGEFHGADGSCLAFEVLSHSFPDQTTASGQEVTGLCRSWTLNNETDLFVNTVHLEQNEGSHHTNFVYVPDTLLLGEDGIWDCASRNYDFYTAVSEGGILYAQSTQATSEDQRFPERVVTRIPAHSRVVSDIHLLNTTAATITGHATISLFGVPQEQVKTELSSFHVEYGDLHIPAHSDTRFTATCSVASAVTAVTGKPYAPRLYYTLPHTHKWGKKVFLQIMGGPDDGHQVFEVGAYNGEAKGQAYDPPIDLSGSDGFKYGCEYQNSGDTEITWGFGAGEMCEIFGFVENTPFFKTFVSDANPGGLDGDTVLVNGHCDAYVDQPVKN